ncbi:MAG: hypothetical protein V1835_04215 [Candidatus Micrarchaeota archaeon]
MNGKLIVIEGTDAVGKATQSMMLAQKLKERGNKVEVINFPTYGSIFGKLIKQYLHGKFGTKDGLAPELVSILYALDRYQYSATLQTKIDGGKYIICNRYSQSNLYQAAKIPDAAKRRKFIEWVWGLESRLPAADAIAFLNLPPSISSKLLIKRGRKIDMHEKDLAYQENVRRAYLDEARKRHWIVIDCTEKGSLKDKKKISKELFAALGKKLRGGI